VSDLLEFIGAIDMMTDIDRIDRFALYDLRFKGKGIPRPIMEILRGTPQSRELGSLYAESFSWVFYGPVRDGVEFRWLPGCERFTFDRKSCNDKGQIFDFTSCKGEVEGISVLINREYGVAVYTVWQRFDGSDDLLDIKHHPWKENRDPDFGGMFSTRVTKEIERHYPFIGIRVNTSDIGKYCTEHGSELGKVFTGNFENEDKAQLEAYIRENLSHREYERLFLRWTEGLGVYDEKAEEKEKALFRALQIFETCILVRVMLRSISQKANELSSRLSVILPRPWAVNRLQQSFLKVQSGLVSAPPVSSVEGERLLRTAYCSFSIAALADSAHKSCDFMERRYQWAKTQLLVGFGIVSYFFKQTILDYAGKLIKWILPG
jgi:hypothetical protein